MNEHYNAFVDLGRRIAHEHGVNWNVRLQADGTAVSEDAWNLTKLVADSPPPVHWVRDFGLDSKALEVLNQKRSQQHLPSLPKIPLSIGWLDLLKALVVDQLFIRKNSTGHVIGNVVRPLRVLATGVHSREPWELRLDDVTQAIAIAKEIQASGKLADLVLGLVKTMIDANHIADIGPIYPALSINRLALRGKRAAYTKSKEELRSDLEERKHAEKLPERRAFWELVRIVFTEQPRSVLDLLRFAQTKVMLLSALRVGETSLLPADWKRTREYYDPSGRAAGELGGYSSALMLRHFAEKQQAPSSDSVGLFETAQYVPSMFEEILSETLSEVSRVTQPLRETLRRQVEECRILPWFNRDQLVSAVELYPYLTGNPFLLAPFDDEQDHWRTRYRIAFDSRVLDELQAFQFQRASAASSTLNAALYVFYNRLKGRITFRHIDGTEWLHPRMQWNEVFLRIDEVEEYLYGLPTKLSDNSPFRLLSGGTLQTWELMFLMPKRALAEGRNEGLCDLTRYYAVGRFGPEMMNHALGGKQGAGPTLFESYGASEEDRSLTLNPHSLRHLQNTELFRLGVADTIITKRFNRRSVAQSYEYDHRSLAEELGDIELPTDVEVSLGSKAATVARMIKAGKASGRIVDAFKTIQRNQGDEAAFDFLKVEADGFHSTPYGYCINSFTVDPCPKHLECFAGCRHLTATGMPKHRRHLVKLEGRLKDAMKAIESRQAKTIGRDNQLAHARSRLEAVRKILLTPSGMQVFPEGADLSKAGPIPQSVLDVNE